MPAILKDGTVGRTAMTTVIQIRRMQLLLVLIVHKTSADGFPPFKSQS